LLLPVVVEVEPAVVAGLKDARPALAALGFDVEEFGPRSLRVLAGPLETPPDRLEAALHEVLDGLADRRTEAAVAALACHSAVRFGDTLDPAEQRRLLEELEGTTPDATCPHGRPTRLLLEWQELKRHFRRNY
jgi:DNA mismatch repair protein MutL